MNRWSRQIIGLAMAAGLTSAPAAAQDPADGSSGGIKVHGHWVIEVRNPDGTLSSRDEFENALVNPTLLASLLGRQATKGHWIVEVGNSATTSDPNSPNPCRSPLFTSYYYHGCRMMPPVFQQNSEWIFSNLTASLQGNDVLVLRGHATAARASSLTYVQTILWSCPSTETVHGPCASTGGNPAGGTAFTERILATPIALQPKQVIQVTVTISFS